MNDRQNAKVNSFNRTRKLIKRNLNIANIVPAFGSYYKTLSESTLEISHIISEQINYNKGITVAKNNAKEKLAITLHLICSQAKSYANNIKDPVLSGIFSFPFSKLKYLKDGLLVPQTDYLLSHITPIIDQLKDYSVTSENLAQVEYEKYAFKKLLDTPHMSISERKNQTRKLNQSIRNCNQFLTKEMDPLAQTFKEINPDFYYEYLSSREIIDQGRTYTKIRGFITDSHKSGMGVKNVKVFIAGTDFITISLQRGRYSLRKIKPGTHDITFSKEGYKTVVLKEVYFKPGAEVNKNIVFEKEEISANGITAPFLEDLESRKKAAENGQSYINLNKEALNKALEPQQKYSEESTVNI
jgi:hypothetical protein